MGEHRSPASGHAVAGCSHGRGRLWVPRPPALEFDLEAEAEEGSDYNDDREDADALQGWRDGNGSNDVGCDQQLEPEQNRPAHVLTKDSVTGGRVHLGTKRQHCRNDQPDDDRGDTHGVDTFADRFDCVGEAHRCHDNCRGEGLDGPVPVGSWVRRLSIVEVRDVQNDPIVRGQCRVVRSGVAVRPDPMPNRSDHRHEFAERSSTAKTVRSGIDAEFVVAAAKILDQRVTF